MAAKKPAASSNTFDYKVLVVTLGKMFVGKTCLSTRFVRGQFAQTFSTVGALHLEKIVEVDGTRIKVEIWDTAGAEQYESLTQQYWRNANGAVVVYDVSQPESLDKCKQWVDQLRENKGQDFPIALAGNKCDLPPQERKLARDAGARYAQEQGLLFEETSAKTGDNVDKLFLALVSRIPIPSELSAKLAVNAIPPKQPEGGCPC